MMLLLQLPCQRRLPPAMHTAPAVHGAVRRRRTSPAGASLPSPWYAVGTTAAQERRSCGAGAAMPLPSGTGLQAGRAGSGRPVSERRRRRRRAWRAGLRSSAHRRSHIDGSGLSNHLGAAALLRSEALPAFVAGAASGWSAAQRCSMTDPMYGEAGTLSAAEGALVQVLAGLDPMRQPSGVLLILSDDRDLSMGGAPPRRKASLPPPRGRRQPHLPILHARCLGCLLEDLKLRSV